MTDRHTDEMPNDRVETWTRFARSKTLMDFFPFPVWSPQREGPRPGCPVVIPALGTYRIKSAKLSIFAILRAIRHCHPAEV